MKAPDAKWQWTPPSLSFGRSHVYLAMGVLTAIAVFTALKGETYLGSNLEGSYDDVAETLSDSTAPSPEPAATQDDFSSAAAEEQIVAAGYQVARSWTPLQVPAGGNIPVTLSLEQGSSYVMLAKGTSGCDTNLILSDDIQDIGPGQDAHLIFEVSTSGEAVVTIPAASSELSMCDVSYAVYRR
jgi:hypothetical protein